MNNNDTDADLFGHYNHDMFKEDMNRGLMKLNWIQNNFTHV